MKNFSTPINRTKAATILRLITTVFVILGPIVMIGSAVIVTLNEGDWWFNLFLVYLSAMVMIAGTLYLSLFTLLREIAWRLDNSSDNTPTVKLLHHLLFGLSITGIITFIPFILIFLDILNGAFAILHFICALVILVLYLINAVLTIKKRNNI